MRSAESAMNIGRLRYRVTLRDCAVTADGAGGATETWSDLATVWAEIEGERGGESEIAEAMRSQARYNVVIRSRTDVRARMRALWVSQGKTLDIRAVVPVGPDLLRLECEEISDAGEVEGS